MAGMKPQEIHFRFWRATLNVPQWTTRFFEVSDFGDPRSLIDAVVNANAGVKKTQGEIAAINLVIYVKMMMRHGINAIELLEAYESIFYDGKLYGDGKPRDKQAAHARRWAKRLRKSLRRKQDV